MITRDKRDKRNFDVLTHIINLYVSTALPVSSKSITERMHKDVSSATVRNIMAELEEEGYLEQPHTSAGRVPTDTGYRYYVNHVKDELKSEKKEITRLAAEYDDYMKSINDMIERTSFLISRELHHPGVVMWPSIKDFHLKHLELVKVKAERVLAVLVTMSNAVRNYMISLEENVDEKELEKISNFVNRNYGEENISNLPARVKEFMERDEAKEVKRLASLTLDVVDEIVKQDIESEIYLSGADYFLEEPEFTSPVVSRSIFKLLSDKRRIMDLMRGDLLTRDISVHIGKENNCEDFKGCSIVTAGYELDGRIIGRMGVIGPTRMNYTSVLRTLMYLSELMSAKLGELDS